MPHTISAMKLLIALSIFISPTLSHSEGIFGNQPLHGADTKSISKTKNSQQNKTDKAAKSEKSEQAKTKKSQSPKTKKVATSKKAKPKSRRVVKSTKKSSKGTIKSYVAYRTSGNHVSTRCFPPRLRAVLQKVQRRYGVKPIVNSGYRSASKNRRVGGARKSYHVKCLAADIKVPGVSKYALARYLKNVSGVGGVGTYACKSFIHVDIGPKRSWHWRCRGRSGRRA
ncbi:MAG: D-Ala-D-Ala carboxypeptidase family metallohydrolase [Hyphomicrobiales bacterium]